MTPREGQKALRRILGKDVAWRENNQAATAEKRAEANIRYADLRDQYEALKVKRDARRAAVLASDVEYQALLAEANALMDERDDVGYISRSYRLTVGRMNGIGFFIRAEGDNWKDVIDKLTQKSSVIPPARRPR